MNNNVKYIALMCFCWGVASSMVFSILPLFIVNDLKCSLSQFGTIEGIVIFCSFIAKLFAGVIIDIFKQKIKLLYIGTIGTVVSKVLLACSSSVWFIICAKGIDRITKGLRHAPVDAILATLTNKKGFVYSYKYTFNIIGSCTGSAITYCLLSHFGRNFRFIFILACLPTLIAWYILRTKINYNQSTMITTKKSPDWHLSYVKYFPKQYWRFLILVSLLMLNRFSEGFITLKANSILKQDAILPLFTSIYEICIIATAIPMGILADRFNTYKVILFGLISILIADVFGIFATNKMEILMIYILAGIHVGSTHSLLSATIAKISSKEYIGTAFAIYYGTVGFVLLIANNLAGASGKLFNYLFNWQLQSGPFIIGVLSTLITIVYLLNMIYKNKNL